MIEVVIRVGGFGQIRNLGLGPKRRLINVHNDATIEREVSIFDLTEYRNYGIETEQIFSLGHVLQTLRIASVRPWIVFGGIGAYLYIDFARRLGCSEEIQKDVGIQCTDLVIRLIMENLKSQNIRVALVDHDKFDHWQRSDFQAYIVRPAAEFLSSDALACQLCHSLGVPLIAFKAHAQYIDLVLEALGMSCNERITNASSILEKIEMRKAMPGNHFFFDEMALDMSVKWMINISLYDSNQLLQLPSIVSGDVSPSFSIIGQ